MTDKIVAGTGGSEVTATLPDGTLDWTYTTNDVVRTAPTVAEGDVFFGDISGNFYSLSLSDGTENWKVNKGSRTDSSPVVFGDTVMYGDDGNDVNAVDRETGDDLYSVNFFNNIRTSPILPNALDRIAYTTNSRSLVGWDAVGGNFTDYHSFMEDGFDVSHNVISPSNIGDTVYVAGERIRSTFFDLDVREVVAAVEVDREGEGISFNEKWRVEEEYSSVSDLGNVPRVVIADGVMAAENLMYHGEGQDLIARSDKNGTAVWRHTADSDIRGVPTFSNSHVIFTDSSDNVYSLQAFTGNVRWKVSIDTNNGKCGSPTVYEGTVYVRTSSGDLVALSEDDGSEIWRETTGVSANASAPTRTDDSFGGSSACTRIDDANYGDHIPVIFDTQPDDQTIGDRHVPTGTVGMGYVLVNYIAENVAANPGVAQLTVENTDKGEILHEEQQTTSFSPGDQKLYVFAETGDLDLDEIEITLDITDVDDTSGRFAMSYGNTLFSDHVHEPDPGLIEEFQDEVAGIPAEKFFPEDVNVIINPGEGDEADAEPGEKFEKDYQKTFGNGNTTFENSVNAKQVLAPGQVNEIRITSESLGHIQAWIEGDVYRQITGGG